MSPMSGAAAYRERDPTVVAGASLRRSHASRRADAQGRRADRRHRHLPPGGPPVHRQADRAGEELRRAGGHRHREHAAAQRAAPAHRRSHRVAGAADRDLARCCRSSPARPANWSRCSRPCWRTRRASAKRSSACCSCYDGDAFPRGCDATVLPPRICRIPAQTRADSAPEPGTALDRLLRTKAGRPHRRSARRALPNAIRRVGAAIGGARSTCSRCRCSRTTSWSARSSSTARRCGPSPTSRSSWCRTSPRRPSSPSRTRGCSTSCASAPTISPSRWSSRPRPPRC